MCGFFCADENTPIKVFTSILKKNKSKKEFQRKLLSSESTLWEARECRDMDKLNAFTLFGGMSFQKYFFENFVSKKSGERNNFLSVLKSTWKAYKKLMFI